MRHRLALFVAGVLVAATLAGRAGAVDGVIEINHERALAGEVTPGDAPGYPVTISRSGSYVLTGDLTPRTAGAIEITADHVHLDLNGFQVRCLSLTVPPPPDRCGSRPGIDAASAAEVAIEGGVVRDFAGLGIRTSRGARLRQLRVLSNEGGGGVLGPRALLEDSRIASNGGDGVAVTLAGPATVRNCDVSENGGRGIVIPIGLVAGSRIASNQGVGVDVRGLGTATGGLVLDNQILTNGGGGLLAPAAPGAAAYGRNALAGNGSFQVLGNAIAVAPNLCDSALCP